MSQALVGTIKSKVNSRAPTLDLRRPAEVKKDPLVETTLSGRYSVLKKIGEGGCGTVYHARDTAGKDVAIKTMLPHLAESSDAVTRFIAEAALGKWILHPNNTRVVDLSLETSPMFFAMEYLEGDTLGNFIRKNGPLTWKQVRDILIPVCEVLAAVHAEGFVHRDIKPDNVFLRDDGIVKLLDLGLAIHIEDVKDREGTCLGTPEYMAPENITGSRIDHRVDVYSLGITAYEMLTGVLPYGEPRVIERIFRGHLCETPDPPSLTRMDVPREADLIVLKAIAKDPNHRFQSTTEMKDALLAA